MCLFYLGVNPRSNLKSVWTLNPSMFPVAKKTVYQDIDAWDSSLSGDDVVKQAYLYLRR